MSHLHLILNHLPIVGSVILLFFFTHAVIYKKDNVIRISFFLYVIIAILAILVYLTGDPSAEIVEKLSGEKEAIIEEHENYAFISLLFFLLTGALSIAALFILNKKKIIPSWLTYFILTISIISVMSISYTAKTGGEIMHPEITNLQINQ